MRNLIKLATIPVAASMLSGCWLDGGSEEDLANLLCDMQSDGIYAGGFGSDIPEYGEYGAFVITEECNAYFIGGAPSQPLQYFDDFAAEVGIQTINAPIAFTARYTEVLPSELYSDDDWADLLDDGFYELCFELEELDCEGGIDVSNLDELLGPVIAGSEITWYSDENSAYGPGTPVIPHLRKIGNDEFAPAHLAVVLEDEYTPVIVAQPEPISERYIEVIEIDRNELDGETSILDAIIGNGGGDEVVPVPVPLSVDAFEGIWFSNNVPALLDIDEQGNIVGDEDGDCEYSGSISDPGLNQNVFNLTLNVSCATDAGFNGTYEGIIVPGGMYEPEFTIQVINGDIMLTDAFYMSYGECSASAEVSAEAC